VFFGLPSSRCLSVNTYFMCGDISVLSGVISMKLDTNIDHVTVNYCEVFKVKVQGHSEVKCIFLSLAFSLAVTYCCLMLQQ